eukprot:350554-Chlamydomonas_euryale.AAC.9
MRVGECSRTTYSPATIVAGLAAWGAASVKPEQPRSVNGLRSKAEADVASRSSSLLSPEQPRRSGSLTLRLDYKSSCYRKQGVSHLLSKHRLQQVLEGLDSEQLNGCWECRHRIVADKLNDSKQHAMPTAACSGARLHKKKSGA